MTDPHPDEVRRATPAFLRGLGGVGERRDRWLVGSRQAMRPA
jgi:hypothetical protein